LYGSAFGDSVDLDLVRVKKGGLMAVGSSRTIGNTIYLEGKYFDSNGELTADGRIVLSHEIVHVWQNQNGGADYMYKALASQGGASSKYGDRDEAYKWRRGMNEGKTFAELNPEQQAKLLAEAFLILNGTPLMTTYTNAEQAYIDEALAAVRAGNGAP